MALKLTTRAYRRMGDHIPWLGRRKTNVHVLSCGCLPFPLVGKFKILAYGNLFHLDSFLDFPRMKCSDFKQQGCYILILTTLGNLFNT